jgi:catechol-2,3-dioxygenase
MSVLGIDRITYGSDDITKSRQFFLDWGLKLVNESSETLDFETLNGCQVWVRRSNDTSLPPAFEAGPTLREVVWGVESQADIESLRKTLASAPMFALTGATVSCQDPNGLGVCFRVTQKRAIDVKGAPTNTWDQTARLDAASTIYERGEPVEVGHIVCFTDDLVKTTAFYESIGFKMSDRYPGRGHFLRTADHGGHHDLFLLQTPQADRGLNHVAFTVRDIHEVFGGGMHVARCGWDTHLGPGRHPISSAYFWYFKNPAGGVVEYYADEDMLTEKWQPRDFTPSPELFAEWAITGGLDGKSRRQKDAPGGGH